VTTGSMLGFKGVSQAYREKVEAVTQRMIHRRVRTGCQRVRGCRVTVKAGVV